MERRPTQRTRAPRRKGRGQATGAGRAALAFIGDRWVAHPLSAQQPASMSSAADGLVLYAPSARRPASGGRAVELQALRSRSAMRENVLVAGCDPAIGLLAAWLGERHRPARVTWLYAPSDAALRALARREVHIAGAHLQDEASGEFNVPFARSAVQADSAVVVNFARNEPALAVSSAHGARLQSFAELPKAKRIVIAAPQVPIGANTAEILERAYRKYGPDFQKQVQARIASTELNVRQVLAKVELGEADAGVVYQTDIGRARTALAAVPIPGELNVRAEYPIAVLKSSRRPELAAAWIELLTSSAGQTVLRELGFLPPTGDGAKGP